MYDTLQTQVDVKAKEAAEQATSFADLTGQHEELQAKGSAQEAALQSLTDKLAMKSEDAQQLHTQLTRANTQLEDAHLEIQHKSAAHSDLESRLSAQAAELGTVTEQRCSLEADKLQLQQELQAAASERQQLQSSLESHQAQSAEQLSTARDEAQQLQVIQGCHFGLASLLNYL